MSSNPVFKAGNLAVITGGASGIGLALAAKFAGYGMTVLIADINAANLASAKEALKGKIDTFEMDVGKIEDFEKLKAKIESEYEGKLSLLALNAAIGTSGTLKSPASYFQDLFGVNVFGVTNGLSTLLPLVLASSTTTSPASIIITGSKQGITNPPGNPAYNASKAAVKTIAEHLSWDLARDSPSTSVHLLVPGWTFTGLSGNRPFVEAGAERKAKPDGAWWPEQVVEYLEAGMAEGTFYVICPDDQVSEEVDRKRMLWGAQDLIYRRPPLTRWREDWSTRVDEWMKTTAD